MDKIVLVIISIFFVIGGIDYILNNRYGYGEKFETGIKSMGALALAMGGILAISPLFGNALRGVVIPIAKWTSVDSSIFTSIFLASDMGGLQIARQLSGGSIIGEYTGIIISSNLGATISFSIPLALGMIKDKDYDVFFKGIIIGIITVPLGGVVAGLMMGIKFQLLIINSMPIIILSILLVIGFRCSAYYMIKAFKILGKSIFILAIIIFIILGSLEVCSVNLPEGITPLSDTFKVVGRIALVVGGALPMIEVMKRYLGNYLELIGKKFRCGKVAVSALIGSLASNIIAFASYNDINDDEKLLITAFSVSGAFVLGGQMGFISMMARNFLIPYIVSKIISGGSALIIAFYCIKRKSN